MAEQERSPKPPETPHGPHLRTVAMPRDANPSGDIFGGWTVSQMDLASATFAANHAGGRVDRSDALSSPCRGGRRGLLLLHPGEGGWDFSHGSDRDLGARARREKQREGDRGRVHVRGPRRTRETQVRSQPVSQDLTLDCSRLTSVLD